METLTIFNKLREIRLTEKVESVLKYVMWEYQDYLREYKFMQIELYSSGIFICTFERVPPSMIVEISRTAYMLIDCEDHYNWNLPSDIIPLKYVFCEENSPVSSGISILL